MTGDDVCSDDCQRHSRSRLKRRCRALPAAGEMVSITLDRHVPISIRCQPLKTMPIPPSADQPLAFESPEAPSNSGWDGVGEKLAGHGCSVPRSASCVVGAAR